MRALLIAAALFASPAMAHDFWSNGEPVPEWIKRYCCSPNEVHHLRTAAVHILPDGYHVDGLKTIIPIKHALPSPDGTYWAFFNDAEDAPSGFLRAVERSLTMTTRKQAVDLVLPNGVRVPAGLTVNEMTFDEWWNKAQWDEQFGGKTREQIRLIARKAGFSEQEIMDGMGTA